MTKINQAMVGEIYSSLNQIVDAYDKVMFTFASIVSDVLEMKGDVRELEEFITKHCADAITGRDLWEANATIHKKLAEGLAEELRIQLSIIAAEGHRIEIDIPLKLKAELKAVKAELETMTERAIEAEAEAEK